MTNEWPQQYGDDYTGGSPHTPAPPAPPTRRAWWPWALLAAAVLFLASGVWYAYEYRIKTDPGIAACEAARDGKKIDGAPVDTTADNKMSEAQYLQLRKIFQDSRHDDIRAAGTKMLDRLWQLQQAGDASVLAYYGQVLEAVSDFQSACANHGIVVKFDMGTGVSASPAPSTPLCSDVFQPGKTIPGGKLTATCRSTAGTDVVVGVLDCLDGRTLYQVDASTGATAGWGFGGEKYQAVASAADDPSYKRAWQKCVVG